MENGNLHSGKIVHCGRWCPVPLPEFGKHEKFVKAKAALNSAIYRCTVVTAKTYELYGGRGIKVCDRWQGKHGVNNFIADVGLPANAKQSLDRIDVNGNYEPGNCRWADAVTQANNQRNNHVITYNGVSLTLTQWGKRLGINPQTISSRLRRGHSIKEALAVTSLQKSKKRDDLQHGNLRVGHGARAVSQPSLLNVKDYPHLTNLVGKQFTRLTVIGLVGSKTSTMTNTDALWMCTCVCGGSAIVRGRNLCAGKVKSCGCLKGGVGVLKAISDEQKAARRIYRGMVGRCTVKSNSGYQNYGARGIKVCKHWLGKDGFTNFFKDMGAPPPNMSLDRIDVNGNYEPANCRWATKQEQANNRRNTRYVTYYDTTLPAKCWAKVIGLSTRGFMARLQNGLTGIDLLWPTTVSKDAPTQLAHAELQRLLTTKVLK